MLGFGLDGPVSGLAQVLFKGFDVGIKTLYNQALLCKVCRKDQ